MSVGVYLMDNKWFLEFMEVLNEYYNDGDCDDNKITD